MANIKNMQMWNDICTDARISINKSLFGLRSTAVYNSTGSIIDARVLEYSPADGEQLLRILCSPREDLAKIIGNFCPKPITNGNYMAEVCTSRDGNFLAVRLLQFSILNYVPLTSTFIFEGGDASIVSKMF